MHKYKALAKHFINNALWAWFPELKVSSIIIFFTLVCIIMLEYKPIQVVVAMNKKDQVMELI